MNIKLPGRKATIATAVVGVLLYFISQGMFEGTTLIVVLGIIALITIAYTYANVYQKTILPVEMGYENGEDDVGSLLLQMDNVRAALVNVEKKADIAIANIPNEKPAKQPTDASK